MKKLGLAVATKDAALLENKVLIDQLITSQLSTVIVNQSITGRLMPVEGFGPNTQVFNVEELGLSKSRNKAFAALDTDFVMLCDDDVELVDPDFSDLIACLPADAAMVFTPLLTLEGKPWRSNYQQTSYSIEGTSFGVRRKIQKINSMEQIFNREFFVEQGFSFDEAFGLGSGRYPMGEDTLMSFSILRGGGKLTFLPIPTRMHPPGSSGESLTPEKYPAIAAIHRKVFSPFGWLMYLAFRLKKLVFPG